MNSVPPHVSFFIHHRRLHQGCCANFWGGSIISGKRSTVTSYILIPSNNKRYLLTRKFQLCVFSSIAQSSTLFLSLNPTQFQSCFTGIYSLQFMIQGRMTQRPGRKLSIWHKKLMNNLSHVRDTELHTEHNTNTLKCSVACVLRKAWRLCYTWLLHTTVQDG